MAAGAITIFNAAKLKVTNNTIKLGSDAFNMALTTSAQSLTAAFAGTSTNAQYSDLTAELTTANGYTVGGVALTSVTWTSSAGVVTFTSASPQWTLTGGGITFAYGVIYDNTSANKDLLCFFQAVSGGGSATEGAGTFTVQVNASGLFTLT